MISQRRHPLFGEDVVHKGIGWSKGYCWDRGEIQQPQWDHPRRKHFTTTCSSV